MKKGIILLLIATAWIYRGYSQTDETEPLYRRMMKDTSVHNFYDIQAEFNKYFEGRDKGRGSGYVQFKRWEMMMEAAVGTSGEMFNIRAKTQDEYQKWLGSFNNTDLPPGYDPGYWISMGPSQYVPGTGWNGGMGRVNCVAFHPTSQNIIFAGTPGGGLWKYNNGWIPLTDGFPSIGISGICIEPDNPDHIFILTGDGDGGNTRSIGVLETFNGGVTWSTTGLSWGVTDDIRGYKMIMHPTNHNILLVASTAGIFRTTNGGTVWTNEQTGKFMDIEFKPGSPSTVYAATDLRFWRSTDTGDTWSSNATGLPNSGSTRIGIAVSPANSGYVYLMYGRSSLENTQSGFLGCYLSTNSGTSFTLKSNSPNIFGYETDGNDFKEQSDYDLAFTADPLNGSVVHFGGINCWLSNDQGVNWSHTSFWYENTTGEQYVHADIHWLEFSPLNHRLYAGCDGGLFYSDDNAATWTDMSAGLVITQPYRMGGYPGDPDLFVCGTQDNGSNTFTAGDQSFQHDRGADGFECMFDYNTYYTRYFSTYGTLFRTDNSGYSYTDITPAIVNGDIWDVAWVMHPTNSSILMMGHDDIWKTTDKGSSWSPMNTGNSGRKFRNIAIGVSNSQRIYAQSVWDAYTTSNGGSSWSNITDGLPVNQCLMSSIIVDQDNSNHAFATFFGYIYGEKVYQTFDAGQNWSNYSQGLPNVPVRCAIYDHNKDGIYIGTDVGVFYKDGTTQGWVPFFNQLPNTLVMEMEINYTTGELIVVTFGRGFWKTKLYGNCAPSYVLTPANNPSTSLSQYYAASNYITSTRTVYSSYNDSVNYKAGNYIRLLPGFETQPGALFEAKTGDCDGLKMNTFHPENRVTGILVRKKD